MVIPILSTITFMPLLGALGILTIRAEKENLIKGTAACISVLTFLLSLPLFFQFNLETWQMQFVEKVPWIAQFGIYYHLGIDGFSLLLLLMTTFITPLAILSAWSAIKKNVKGFMVSLLLLETGMIGTFCALDFFLFYIFWELMLIPMYLIIGIWGGKRRIYSAVKFFIYTMLGSVLMLVAILVLYHINYNETGVYSFDIQRLYLLNIPLKTQTWLFLAFFLAFAIKVPMFPFHTWLPDAHVEAPTAGSVILAGVLLKMGTYGFIRFCLPIFPDATMDFIPLIRILAVIGIIYGALVAFVQEDMKKLVAYSSVSHLGYCMLGMFALNLKGIQGSMLQMVNHGLSTGALFLMVGILYERTHTRQISAYGSLYKILPIYSILLLIVSFSSIGVPGLNGFVGELYIMIGAFQAHLVYALIATIGLFLGPLYLLWMYQRVILGNKPSAQNKLLKDLNSRELAYLLPIILFIIWIGVYPKPFLKTTEASTIHLLEKFEKYQKPKLVMNETNTNQLLYVK